MTFERVFERDNLSSKYIYIFFVKLHVHAILNDNLGGHDMTHFWNVQAKTP